MIRLILTIMLSALAFVSMDANDCVTPTQAYYSRGGLVWEVLPDVYGEVMECRGDRTLVPFRYQGQYEDVETGLYYNRFRYYSPQMGMYISSDPIGLAGNDPTLYGYVFDNNSQIDTFGLYTWSNHGYKIFLDRMIHGLLLLNQQRLDQQNTSWVLILKIWNVVCGRMEKK